MSVQIKGVGTIGGIDQGLNTVGVITATSFVGDGSNLTGLSGLSVANQADNRLITCTGTTDALNGEANFTYDGTSLLLGSGAVATPKVTQAGSLDLDSGGISLCIGGNENSNGRTNSSNKLNRVVTPHYTNAEEPMAMISGYSTSGQSQLFYGGGSGLTNAVTEHNFYTTANTTTTSGTKRLRIRSNGEIQIGSIDTPSASRGALAIKASTDAQSVPINLYLQESSGGEGYGVGVDGDGDLNFYNGGATSPTLEIRDDNNVAITDGNLVFASGHGINFSANTSEGGTSTATLLEDYEEGSYTITSNANLTLDNQRTGYYTKIGNMVNVIGYLSLNTNDGSPSVTGTNGIVLSLPYARSTSAAVAYTGTILQQNIDSDTPTSLVGHPLWYKVLPVDYVCMAASDGLRFYINKMEAAYTRMNNSHLHVGYPGYTYIVWNITYRTN